MVIGGMFSVEEKMGSEMVYGTRGAPVEEVCSRVHGLNPKGGRHGGLGQECSKDIVGRTNAPFGFAILWRSVRAG
jgi:hypothetical protein